MDGSAVPPRSALRSRCVARALRGRQRDCQADLGGTRCRKRGATCRPSPARGHYSLSLMGGSTFQLAKRRVIRRRVVRAIVYYLVAGLMVLAIQRWLTLSVPAVVVVVACMFALSMITYRQPSALIACPFCRHKWPSDPGHDRRAICASCAMRCRPYLLERRQTGLRVPRLIQDGRRERAAPLSPPTPTQYALSWAERPGLILLIIGGVGVFSIVVLFQFGLASIAGWVTVVFFATLVVTVPWAIVTSSRRFKRLAQPLGSTCWRCKYDLSSLVAAKPEGVIRCPECGLETDPHAPADPAVAAGDAQADRVTSR